MIGDAVGDVELEAFDLLAAIGQHGPEFRLGSGELAGIVVDQGNVQPFCDELFGHGLADAAGGACDDGDGAGGEGGMHGFASVIG